MMLKTIVSHSVSGNMKTTQTTLEHKEYTLNTQKVVSILLLLAFATPFHVFAQQQDSVITQEQRKAIQDAKDDAGSFTNALNWVALGCMLPFISILGAHASNPTIRVDKLIGKSPEYISFYTETYRHETQQQNIGAATAGSFVSILGLAIIFGAIQDSPGDSCVLPVHVTNTIRTSESSFW